jgi:hypothetical protein
MRAHPLPVRLPPDVRDALDAAVLDASHAAGVPVTRTAVVVTALRAFLDARSNHLRPVA